MLSSWTRSLVAVIAIVMMYAGYAQIVPPMLEGDVVKRTTQLSTEAQRQQSRQAINRYKKLFSVFFPSDHWVFSEKLKIKVIENRKMMVVFGDYQRPSDYELKISQCAILFFPQGRDRSEAPPRETIVADAPNGAILKFDKKILLGQGELGKIEQGHFPGLITIRSDMREAGPQDDLLVRGSNFQLNQKLFSTHGDVTFQFGANKGSGRYLEIRMLQEKHSQHSKSGLAISGLQSLEIFNNVKLSLAMKNEKLFPQSSQLSQASRPASLQASDENRRFHSPVELTCEGSFHFDFIDYVATLDKNVIAWQSNPIGDADQLTCQKLQAIFRPEKDLSEESDWERETLDLGERQRRELGKLTPYKLIATGDLVRIISPTENAEATAQRLEIDLVEKKITLDGQGQRDVVLRIDQFYVHAPMLWYQDKSTKKNKRIGDLYAAGPGHIHGVMKQSQQPGDKKTTETFHAAWEESVTLNRHNGQPVLSLKGSPELRMASLGRVNAEVMYLYLNEVTKQSQQPGTKKQKLMLLPDRMQARGNVRVESPQGKLTTKLLTAWFHRDPNFQAAPKNKKGLGSFAASGPGGGLSSSLYNANADSIGIQMVMSLDGKQSRVKKMVAEGHISLREMNPAPGTEPVELRGARVVVNVDANQQAFVTITGSESGPAQPATIFARGTTVQSDKITLDQKKNMLTLVGAGQADLVIDRDFQGNQAGQGYPVKVQWQSHASFDGERIQLHGDVTAEGPTDWLTAQMLEARLNHPITFGRSFKSSALEIMAVTASGEVVLDHRTVENNEIRSQELIQLREQVTMHLPTGVLKGTGPGWIRSIHYADSKNRLKTGPQPAVGGASKESLHYLRVDFSDGLVGNYKRKNLRFKQQVRAIYGPVNSWSDKLALTPEGQLPFDTIFLTSNELLINENPTAALMAARQNLNRPKIGAKQKFGPLELQAIGNVTIEGANPKHGNFTARASIARYDQLKAKFVLEGDQTNYATIKIVQPQTGRTIRQSAKKLSYWHKTNELKFDKIRSIDGSMLQNMISGKSFSAPATENQGLPWLPNQSNPRDAGFNLRPKTIK